MPGSKNLSEVVELGKDIASEAAAGAAIGFITAGPPGAAIGGLSAGGTAVIQGTVQRVLDDMTDRRLSTREFKRLGAGASFAVAKIVEHAEAGRDLRNDGFFAEELGYDSPAAEILEGVLLKCVTEHQEKKTKYIGNIFGNAAFDATLSAEQLNFILNLASDLTYRQLCLISLVQRGDEIGYSRPWGQVLSTSRRREHPDQALMVEIRDLSSGLIHAWGNTEDPPYLDPLGEILYRVMGLNEIPAADLERVAQEVFGTD